MRQKMVMVVYLATAVWWFLSMVLNLVRPGGGSGSAVSTFLFVSFTMYFVILFIINYQHFVKSGLLMPQRVRLENGYLITGFDGNSRFPCENYSVIKQGCGIVMIGTRKSSRITGYIGIPKRAFSCREEQEAFLRLLANSVLAEEGSKERPMPDRGGDLVFLFDVSEERWVRIYQEAERI